MQRDYEAVACVFQYYLTMLVCGCNRNSANVMVPIIILPDMHNILLQILKYENKLLLFHDIMMTRGNQFINSSNENILILMLHKCFNFLELNVDGSYQLEHLGPLLLTWFKFNPSMDK